MSRADDDGALSCSSFLLFVASFGRPSVETLCLSSATKVAPAAVRVGASPVHKVCPSRKRCGSWCGGVNVSTYELARAHHRGRASTTSMPQCPPPRGASGQSVRRGGSHEPHRTHSSHCRGASRLRVTPPHRGSGGTRATKHGCPRTRTSSTSKERRATTSARPPMQFLRFTKHWR